jgi:hypothetical protein
MTAAGREDQIVQLDEVFVVVCEQDRGMVDGGGEVFCLRGGCLSDLGTVPIISDPLTGYDRGRLTRLPIAVASAVMSCMGSLGGD